MVLGNSFKSNLGQNEDTQNVIFLSSSIMTNFHNENILEMYLFVLLRFVFQGKMDQVDLKSYGSNKVVHVFAVWRSAVPASL